VKIEAKPVKAPGDEIPGHPSNPRPLGSKAKLTPTQRRLISEIDEIAKSIQMDYWNILNYNEEGRTIHLKLMKRQLVIGEIIIKYTLIDEFLSTVIAHYFFKRPKANLFAIERMWRNKKFQLFAHYFLDESYLLAKVRLVHAIKKCHLR